MIKLLPIFLILVAIAGGVVYYRLEVLSDKLPETVQGTSLDDQEVNNLKSAKTPTDLESRLKIVETGVSELKIRVSSLEKITPAPQAPQVLTPRVPVYIPLGSGGSLSDQNWTSLNSFQISLDPASYPGYSSMKLEVNMRLNQPGGQVYARLYNITSNTAIPSEVSTDSTTSSVVTSGGFTLATGQKTYVLQGKSSAGTVAFIDYARIKVNF